eukprot:TRINITY_DN1905_c0_g1_i1.p1 TRINITY_DN1905_c0_g1~~TRINITY_DN1905_c0_g1_i1.p1  ORF type:complete len:396 (-),score=72.02 TRINITY_DN1905_c0_g1_i1:38-1165(-)
MNEPQHQQLQQQHYSNPLSYPFISFCDDIPHTEHVFGIVQLMDNTLLSCAFDCTIKRWTVDGCLLTTFIGHSCHVWCVMEVDENTFISGSADMTIKVWNLTTGQCFHTISTTTTAFCLLRLKNNNTFLYGREERRLGGNYELLHTLDDSNGVVCLCELNDGRVVSGSGCVLKVWDMNTKTVCLTLTGHSGTIWKVIELKRRRSRGGGHCKQLIATASSDTSVRIWNVTTGECLQVLRGEKYDLEFTECIGGLIEMSDGTLFCASIDTTVDVWSISCRDGGDYVSTSQMDSCGISCMRLLRDGSVILGYHNGHIEIRKTSCSSQESKLYELCCESIAKNQDKFDMKALQLSLPTELNELIQHHIQSISFSASTIQG